MRKMLEIVDENKFRSETILFFLIETVQHSIVQYSLGAIVQPLRFKIYNAFQVLTSYAFTIQTL